MILEVAVKTLAFVGTIVSIVQFLRLDTKRRYMWLIIAFALVVGGVTTYFTAPSPQTDSAIRETKAAETVPQVLPKVPPPDFSKLDHLLAVQDSLVLGISDGAQITVERVLKVLKNKSLTELQKRRMIQKTQGKRVRWFAVIKDIKPVGFHGELLAVFSPASQIDDPMPEILTATFPSTEEHALANVTSGDTALIEGALSFPEFAGMGWTVGLDDGRLLVHPVPDLAKID